MELTLQIKDFILGLLFALMGSLTMLASKNLGLGSASVMQPGFYPFLVGSVLLLCGVFLMLKNWPWKF